MIAIVVTLALVVGILVGTGLTVQANYIVFLMKNRLIPCDDSETLFIEKLLKDIEEARMYIKFLKENKL